MKYALMLYAILLSALLASAARNGNAKVSDLAEHALQQSQLTLPGSRLFHLQATLVETTNPKSQYQAKIEEFWLSPTKWRRAIESPGFSQTLIVDGDRVSEKNVGDYFPWWLNKFVIALFDPIPMLDRLKQSNSEMPELGAGASMPTCSDLHTRTDRWVICFEGGHGLLDSVFMKFFMPVRTTAKLCRNFPMPKSANLLSIRWIRFFRLVPPALKEVVVNSSVDQTGKFTGGGPASEMPTDVFFAAYKAVTQRRFHPYVLNGKTQYFHATVTFPVK